MSNKIKNPFAFIKLSQATTVCFDKENALCDGEILIKKMVVLDPRANESEISQAISNVLNAVNERNSLVDALKKKYDFELSTDVKKVYPFDHQTRTMGASFKGGKTYFIGLVENMSIKNKPGILKRCEEYTKYGQDVYALGQCENENINNLDVVALIITKEHIRESMVEAIKWLNEHNINVKVVSNGNTFKASCIAYDAGVLNVNKQVSMEHMVKPDTDKYVVFGDAQRQEKDTIIKTLKAKGEKVVYINDDFENLPRAFEESKRLTDNLHRVSLFLISKALLVVFLTLFLVIGYGANAFENPFGLYRYLVLDAIISIIATVLLMLERNESEVKGKFVFNALKKSLPSAFMMYAASVLIFVLYLMQKNGLVNFGIYNMQTAIAMSMIAITVLGALVFYNTCLPLSKYRRLAVTVVVLISIAMLVASGIISYTSNTVDPVFGIPFMEMNGPTYLITALIVVVLSSLYFILYKIFRKDDKDEN